MTRRAPNRRRRIRPRLPRCWHRHERLELATVGGIGLVAILYLMVFKPF